MLADLVGPLADEDSRPLRDWLTDHGVDTECLWSLPRWNTEPLADGEPSRRRPPDRSEQARADISAQLTKVVDQPAGSALVLLYLFAEVADAWETSYHFRLLWDALRAAPVACRDQATPREQADEVAASAVLGLMAALDAKITAENALTRGLFGKQAEALQSAAGEARAASALAETLPPEYAAIGAYVRRAAARDVFHSEALARAVRGTEEFFSSGASLEPVVTELAAAAHSPLLDRVHRSELRACRHSLAALQRDRTADWLRLDEGTLVYLYPFAVRGIAPGDLVALAAGEADRWVLGGVHPRQVHRALELDDRWDGSDSLGRRYDGAAVELPDVVMGDLAGSEEMRVTAQIVFSTLGNHHLRFEFDMRAVSPAEMYALMLRVAPEHGAGRILFDVGEGRPAGPPGRGGGDVWPRLSDMALQLALDVGEAVQGGAAEGNGRGEGARVVMRPGMFQVVVSVDAASTAAGPVVGAAERQEVATVEEFCAAAGAQVFTNPVAHLVGSVGEWGRYATVNDHSRAFRDMTQGWLLTTCNTVVLVDFGAPDFDMRGRRAMAEFAASLDGLFTGWFDELADHYRRVKNVQVRAAEAGDGASAESAAALLELAKELDEEKMRLDGFAVDARSTMALIRSPSLVSAPVDAHMLQLLLENSGYPQRVEELLTKIDEVANERLALTIEKIANQRSEQMARDEARVERRRRAKLDSMLAIIAAVGISGLGQILQTGYGVEKFGSLLIISMIVLLAIFVGTGFWLAARKGT